MAEWFRRKSEKINTTLKKDIKEGVWIKCSNCGNVLSKKILKETKCDAVKLEGGKKVIKQIKFLIKNILFNA